MYRASSHNSITNANIVSSVTDSLGHSTVSTIYVSISKNRLDKLLYIETNYSTIINTAVLLSDITESAFQEKKSSANGV
jgi:hypothetical protein